jgi:hypothetical protein
VHYHLNHVPQTCANCFCFWFVLVLDMLPTRRDFWSFHWHHITFGFSFVLLVVFISYVLFYLFIWFFWDKAGPSCPWTCPLQSPSCWDYRYVQYRHV